MSGDGLILATKRLRRDLQQFQLDTAAQTMYHVEPVSEGNIFELKARIYGPPDTPYHGGVFHLEIKVGENYPFKSPNIKFTTNIWHPNISSSGGICLDTLQSKWSAAFSLRTAMMSIQALLSSPFSEHGLNTDALKQMNESPENLKKTAAFWTYHYAMDNKPAEMVRANAPLEEMIKQVVTKTGKNYEKALKILSCTNWDIKKVLNPPTAIVPSTKPVKRVHRK